MDEIKRLLELPVAKEDAAAQAELRTLVQQFDHEEQRLNVRNLLFPDVAKTPQEDP